MTTEQAFAEIVAHHAGHIAAALMCEFNVRDAPALAQHLTKLLTEPKMVRFMSIQAAGLVAHSNSEMA